ncbi:hypothetical protein SNEBB_009680 [Seison nebaliae]|nr:hypothetical protein SNEBB_009680 [Seison nebaliae]
MDTYRIAYNTFNNNFREKLKYFQEEKLFEGKQPIDHLRGYQKDILLELINGDNSTIHLPRGIGRTLIFSSLINYFNKVLKEVETEIKRNTKEILYVPPVKFLYIISSEELLDYRCGKFKEYLPDFHILSMSSEESYYGIKMKNLIVLTLNDLLGYMMKNNNFVHQFQSVFFEEDESLPSEIIDKLVSPYMKKEIDNLFIHITNEPCSSFRNFSSFNRILPNKFCEEFKEYLPEKLKISMESIRSSSSANSTYSELVDWISSEEMSPQSESLNWNYKSLIIRKEMINSIKELETLSDKLSQLFDIDPNDRSYIHILFEMKDTFQQMLGDDCNEIIILRFIRFYVVCLQMCEDVSSINIQYELHVKHMHNMLQRNIYMECWKVYERFRQALDNKLKTIITDDYDEEFLLNSYAKGMCHFTKEYTNSLPFQMKNVKITKMEPNLKVNKLCQSLWKIKNCPAVVVICNKDLTCKTLKIYLQSIVRFKEYFEFFEQEDLKHLEDIGKISTLCDVLLINLTRIIPQIYPIANHIILYHNIHYLQTKEAKEKIIEIKNAFEYDNDFHLFLSNQEENNLEKLNEECGNSQCTFDKLVDDSLSIICRRCYRGICNAEDLERIEDKCLIPEHVGVAYLTVRKMFNNYYDSRELVCSSCKSIVGNFIQVRGKLYCEPNNKQLLYVNGKNVKTVPTSWDRLPTNSMDN